MTPWLGISFPISIMGQMGPGRLLRGPAAQMTSCTTDHLAHPGISGGQWADPPFSFISRSLDRVYHQSASFYATAHTEHPFWEFMAKRVFTASLCMTELSEALCSKLWSSWFYGLLLVPKGLIRTCIMSLSWYLG